MAKPKALSALTGAAVLASSVAAHATVISYGASGSQGGDALGARADFTTGANFIDVTLTNTLAPSAIVGAGSALSDVQFTLSNAPGTQGTLTASGQLGNLDSNGNVTVTTGSPVRFIGMGPPPPGGTGTFTVTGDTILMEALGGGQPSQMILPNAGAYPNANSSIIGFSPSTIGPASFVLDFAGVTADTTITTATFSFGTGPDHTLTGDVIPPPVDVPEPASLALLGTALAAFGLYRRRKSA